MDVEEKLSCRAIEGEQKGEGDDDQSTFPLPPSLVGDFQQGAREQDHFPRDDWKEKMYDQLRGALENKTATSHLVQMLADESPKTATTTTTTTDLLFIACKHQASKEVIELLIKRYPETVHKPSEVEDFDNCPLFELLEDIVGLIIQ